MEIKDNILYFRNYKAEELVSHYGSPLFVYEEEVLRARCRDLKSFINKPNLKIHYSCKANNNIALLKIIKEEGLLVDAMSPGEVYLELQAGFKPEEILYVCNNISKKEMEQIINQKIMMSVDSLSQLEYYGALNRGGDVFVRINPGIGDGHHQKVITAGKAKFGIMYEKIDQIKETAKKYELNIIGINMHIGSLFLRGDNYLEAIKKMLTIAENFDNLQYIDFGGGIGIPYDKVNEDRFPLKEFGEHLKTLLDEWEEKNNKKDITFLMEPGRFIVAECGTALTTVNSIKENYGIKYIGTDLGFNLNIRPELYDAYHEIVVTNNVQSDKTEKVTICGNICESGDLLAQDRLLPHIELDNVLAVQDCGAYVFVMSSNYNARLKPREILIKNSGEIEIIRERENLEYLTINYAD